VDRPVVLAWLPSLSKDQSLQDHRAVQIRASPRHARKIVANQIDLICALQLMSAERPLAAYNGGYTRAGAD
jgi:hypothetical protein